MEDSTIFSDVTLNKLKQILGMSKIEKVTVKHPLMIKLEKILAIPGNTIRKQNLQVPLD